MEDLVENSILVICLTLENNTMIISSNFDGGNIEFLGIEDKDHIKLNIIKDYKSESFQWFYFRLQEARGRRCKLSIMNASEASYPDGWNGYRVCVSYDKERWFRLDTQYDGKSLSFEITPEFDSVFFAYFEPYSYEKHLDLVSIAQMSPVCRLESLGKTVDERDIDLLIAGEPSLEKKSIWIIGRQHSGEAQASWFMEGFVSRLLDPADATSRKLLERADVYIVPMINPDGVVRGNIRANAAGLDLNREWQEPDEKTSPEVFHIRNKMDEVGVDLNLDIHGDEELPYNFISSIEGIPSWNDKLAMLDELLKDNWITVNPDMQKVEGYPKNEPGKANLKICSKQIGERFKCLSWTVEMPFKDNANLPDEVYGWSAERSVQLGESLVSAIYMTIDEI